MKQYGKAKVCEKFGQRVRKFRKQKGISQEEFADLIGIHRTYASRIERGQTNPPLYTIHRIAKVLGIIIGELMDF